jgi:hypothetical protein
MKLKRIACAVLVAFGMASCTAESDAIMNEVETVVSLEKDFNARSVDNRGGEKNGLELDNLIPASTDEATTILNMLREKKGLTETCSVTTKEGATDQSFLDIYAEQCVNNRYTLALQLQMISYADDNSLYYKDCKVSANSSQFLWHMTGFGFSSDGTNGMYKFECTSYLYFKVVEDGVKYLQIPVKVNGKYNPETHDVSFDYSI